MGDATKKSIPGVNGLRSHALIESSKRIITMIMPTQKLTYENSSVNILNWALFHDEVYMSENTDG